MRGDPMCWERRSERTWTMDLPGDGGADWVEVKRAPPDAVPVWRVDACLNGSHYKMADKFPTMEQAQGCALLLAMRQVPASRHALHAQLDTVPDAWWWKILPIDDTSAEHRAIFSSRVLESAEAAERSGRAAGAGWVLYVYGPGSVRTFGQLPR
jgi:hypothetical protein